MTENQPNERRGGQRGAAWPKIALPATSHHSPPPRASPHGGGTGEAMTAANTFLHEGKEGDEGMRGHSYSGATSGSAGNNGGTAGRGPGRGWGRGRGWDTQGMFL